MPTAINSNYSPYTGKTNKTSDENKKEADKKEDEKGIIERTQENTGIKTDRGTRIVKKGQDLDKNAFLRYWLRNLLIKILLMQGWDRICISVSAIFIFRANG